MSLLLRVPRSAWLRLALCVLAMVISIVVDRLAPALPWALLIASLDITLLVFRTWGPEQQVKPIAYLLLTISAVSSGFALGLRGAALGILLTVPALHAGEIFGRKIIAAIAFVGAASAVVADLAITRTVDERMLAFVPWILLAAACGLLARTTTDRIPPPPPPGETDVAAEAGVLVRRLHRLADSLSTGFDAPAAAEMALQALAAATPTIRSAVLVGLGSERPVPLAVRGGDRAPWPDPTVPGSLLHEAWTTPGTVLGEWEDEGYTRSLLAVPILDPEGKRLGLMVADRGANTPFTRADLGAARLVAREHSPVIDLAVVFANLRETAVFEERERIAREMHDGIAQEMVAFGFGLDAIRRTARNDYPDLAPHLDALREDLTRVLSDLRLHIADLRIAVRPDTGLGAMVGTRLQGFGAAQGLATRVQISETGFRLPAHTEVLIYRLFLQVLNEARTAVGITGIDVSLTVAAPRVEFQIVHDGDSHLRQESYAEHPLVDLGAQITIEHPPTGGVAVRLRMRARGQGHADLTQERIPQFS